METFTSVNRSDLLTLATESLVVTVNQRLARSLNEAYSETRLRMGHKVWKRPQICAWELWLQSCLEQLDLTNQFFTDYQEQHLWEKLIFDDLDENLRAQLQVPATARLSREAHRLLVDFECDFAPQLASRDHQAFLGWRNRYRQKIAELGVLDRAEIPLILRQAIVDKRLPVPQRLILAGFDDLRPLQIGLLEELQTQGCNVLVWDDNELVVKEKVRVDAADPADEVRCCALWARTLLDQGVKRIGIVVNDPQRYRRLLEKALMAELTPEQLLQGERVEGVFSFSLGNVLAEEGIVATAVQLLTYGYALSFDEISYVLRSPWLGDYPHDIDSRMQMELELRRSGQVSWPLHKLSKTIHGLQGRASKHNVLSGLTAALSSSLKESSQHQSAGLWSEKLLKFLDLCGWPGTRTLSSRDYQAREEFYQLFNELSSLERVGSGISRSEAVAFLKRRSQEKSFQVKETTGHVQVLGVLESSGLDFEHLWVLGMHDGTFPSPPRPNPFIPVPLQSEKQMPHADAQRELDFSARVSKRLFNSANHLVASFPRQDDGVERLPSSFLNEFDLSTSPFATGDDLFSVLQRQSVALETLVDAQAPPVVANKPVSGGTGLIKEQSLCPFRAFVHHRLRSDGLQSLDIGLNALQRGSLTHYLLEHFWKHTLDSETLLSLTPEQRRNRLVEAAEAALARVEKEQRRDLPAAIRRLETERLVRLGLEWLEVDQNRAPFKVAELEKTHRCSLGKLEIKTQIDRIDELAQGGFAIIDYKTGRPDPSTLLDERLSEPQLPIYAHDYDQEALAAILFAQVRRGDCRYRGLADRDTEVPGVPDRKVSATLDELGLDFQGVLQRWKKLLPEIANAFVNGDAAVSPLENEKTCLYCDCHSVCRIYERQIAVSGAGDD